MIFNTRFRDQLPTVVADEFDSLYAGLKSFFNVSFLGDGTLRPSVVTNNLVPIGSVLPFAGTTPPTGWALCDGSQVNRVTYQSLFAVIGVAYGGGDGSTTFNLPDLRQRFPLGKATSGTGATLGSTGGAIDHTHSAGSHTHSIPSLSVGGQSFSGTTGSVGDHNHSMTTSPPNRTATAVFWTSEPAFVNAADEFHTHTGTTSDAGGHSHSYSGTTSGSSTGTGTSGSASGGTTGTNNPPFLTLNYIILLNA